jgi:hypothetical protein
VLGAPASLMGSELQPPALHFCQSFMGLFPDSEFAGVYANLIEFSMDCFPENPSAPPQIPKHALGFARSTSA